MARHQEMPPLPFGGARREGGSSASDNSNSNTNTTRVCSLCLGSQQTNKQDNQQQPTNGRLRITPPVARDRRRPDETAHPPPLRVGPRLTSPPLARSSSRENNYIEEIRHLNSLPNLIFLDLYNNCIEHLSGDLGSVSEETTLRESLGGGRRARAIARSRPSPRA